MNMYVSNLGFHVTDEDLRKLFADFGVVDSAKVIMDRMTNQSRGFGFVEMQNDTEAETAMQKLGGKEIEGRSISVSKAKPKTDSFSNNRNSRW
jgi:RNA recognition motif-containing protein